MSAKVPCNGCTQCCQWEGDESLKPDPSLRMDKETGNCDMLIPGKGCMAHTAAPMACKNFDCRKLVAEVMEREGAVYLKILVRGAQKLISENA